MHVERTLRPLQACPMRATATPMEVTIEKRSVVDALRGNLKQVVAGLITGFEMIADATSFAALFTSVLSSHPVMAAGEDPGVMDALIKSGLFGLLVAQLAVTVGSNLSPHVVAIGWEAVPQMLTLAAYILDNVEVQGSDATGGDAANDLAYTAMLTVVACSVLINATTGIIMLVMGTAGLVELVSYIPETTITGLFACIGYQLFTLGFDLSTDSDASFNLAKPSSLEHLGDSRNWPRWLVGLLLGMALTVGARKIPERFSSLLIPMYYFACMVIFHVVFASLSWDLATSADKGWTVRHFDAQPVNTFVIKDFYEASRRIDWGVLLAAFPQILVVALIGPIFNTALNLPLLLQKLKQKTDPNKEFCVASVGHIIKALGCGVNSYISVSNTMEHRANGGTLRLSTLPCCLLYAFFFLCHPVIAVLRVVINPMLGGIYFFMGIDEMWNDFGPDTLQRLSIIDYAIMLAMLAIFIATGMNLLNPFILAVTVTVVRLLIESSSGRSFATHGVLTDVTCGRVRSGRDNLVFHNRVGESTYVFRLCGVLTFLRVKRMFSTIEDAISTHTGPKLVRILVDFEHVQSIDTSAAMALLSVLQDLAGDTMQLYFSGLVSGGRVHRMLKRQAADLLATGRLNAFTSFQVAVASIEAVGKHLEAVTALADASGRRGKYEKLSSKLKGVLEPVLSWITANKVEICPSGNYAFLLHFLFAGQVTRRQYAVNDQLCSDDSKTDGVWVLLSGEVVGCMAISEEVLRHGNVRIASMKLSDSAIPLTATRTSLAESSTQELSDMTRKISSHASGRLKSLSLNEASANDVGRAASRKVHFNPRRRFKGSQPEMHRHDVNDVVPVSRYGPGTIVGARGLLVGSNMLYEEALFAATAVDTLFISHAHMAEMRDRAASTPAYGDCVLALAEQCILHTTNPLLEYKRSHVCHQQLVQKVRVDKPVAGGSTDAIKPNAI